MTTLTEYAAAITRLIDEATGASFTYPDTFDGDAEACFAKRMAPQEAADKLMLDYGLTDSIMAHYNLDECAVAMSADGGSGVIRVDGRCCHVE